MTYSVGGLIQATDYNGFVSTNVSANVNATWNTTYGQTALSTVSAGGIVTATQWATLNGTVTSMANHQNTTITSRTNPAAGNTIAILSNLSTDIGSCFTRRFFAAASGAQFTGWTGTASQTSKVGDTNTNWTITFTDTITFANATACTNFFGAGGLIKTEFSKTSTGNDADPEWNNLVNTICGDVYFSSDASSKTIAGTSYTGTTVIGGTGTPSTVATGTGFNQLSTGTPVTIYKQFDTAYTYTTNYVEVIVTKTSNTVLTFTTNWFSAARSTSGSSRSISGGTATTGITFGTAPTTVVTYFPPSTTYLTNTWGAPTVASTVSATPYS
jgi:hypothetical protein